MSDPNHDGVPEIDARTLAERLRRGERIVLLDCREPEELQIARLDGAVHIPLNEITVRFTELDPDDEIVVVCRTGRRSYSVAAWLRERGFDRVWNLAGGLHAWSDEVDGNIPKY